ncbi:MAG TPA: hypothetical protein VKF38_14415 [Anaerolineaceae bacterium]|nr:hypothetical protein [Anaerolineaceae bacterium]
MPNAEGLGVRDVPGVRDTAKMRKVGSFLIVIGVALIVLFVLSDVAHAREFHYLLYGMIILLIGIFVVGTNPKPPVESNRFRMLKRKSEKQKNSNRPTEHR